MFCLYILYKKSLYFFSIVSSSQMTIVLGLLIYHSLNISYQVIKLNYGAILTDFWERIGQIYSKTVHEVYLDLGAILTGT